MLKNSYESFEESLDILLKKAKQNPVSLKTLLSTLSGKGKIFLLIILSLGFAQIPGIAIFFGLIIAYLGVRVAIGNHFIWLPKWLSNKRVPFPFLSLVIPSFLKFLKFLRRFSHPRYEWATQTKRARILNGSMLVIIGISIAMSPPVPLSIWIACFGIFFLAIGLLNDDGLYVLFGVSSALLYLFAVIVMLNFFSVDQIVQWAKGIKEHLFR